MNTISLQEIRLVIFFMICFGTRFKSPLLYSSTEDSLPVHQSVYIQRYCHIGQTELTSSSSQVATVTCVEICQKRKLQFDITITGHFVRHVAESGALYTPI